MSVDAQWPNLPTYGTGGFTAEEHKAHTTPRGVAMPDDLYPGLKANKLAKLAMKFAKKPHLKMTGPKRAKTPKRKKK